MATIAELTAVITADTSGFDAGVDSANQKLQELGQQGTATGKDIGKIADGFNAAGKLMAAGGAAMLAPIYGAVKQAATLEQAMDKVGVAFGVTEGKSADMDAQFREMEDTINEVASSTIFGAQDVAQAAIEMGKAGLDFKTVFGEVGDSTDGIMQGVADFAAATDTALPMAAKIASGMSNQWQMSNDELIGSLDDLTTVFNSTSLGAEDFMGGMANWAPQARMLGVSFEDAAATLGFFTDQGLTAREAGTSLSRMFDAAIAPTDKQAEAMARLGLTTQDFMEINEDGISVLKDIPDVLDMMKTHMDALNLSTEDQLDLFNKMFGLEAKDVAALGMLSNTDDLRELNKLMDENTGIAREQSKALTDNLLGAIEELGGSWDVLNNTMGDPFLDPLTEGVRGVTKLVDALAGAPPAIQGFVGKMMTATGGLLTFGGLAAWGTGKVLDLGRTFGKAGLSLGKFTLGLGALGAALGLGLLAYETNFMGFGDAVDEAMGRAGKAVETFGRVFDEAFFENQNAEMGMLAAGIAAFGTAMDDAFGTDISDETRKLAEGIDVLTDSFEAGQEQGIDPWVNALESAAKATRKMGWEDTAKELHKMSQAWDAMQQSMTETEGKMPQLNRELSALQAALDVLFGDDFEKQFGVRIPEFFDNLGSEMARMQDDITEFWNNIKEEGDRAGKDIGDALANAGQFFQNLGDAALQAKNDVGQFFDNLGSEAGRTRDDIGQWFEDAGQFFSNIGSEAARTRDDVVGWFEDFGSAIQGADPLGGLQNISDGIGDWFSDVSTMLMGGMQAGPNGVPTEVPGLVNQLAEGFGQSLAGLGDQVMQALPDENPFDAVGTWLQDSLDEVGRFFMPQEMPAGLGGAGMGDTSGISQWFSGMVDGIGAGMDQAVTDLGALAEEKKTGFKNALGDFFGPIGQFLFPSEDAQAAGEMALGDPGEIGKQFGESLLNTFKDPAFADALQSSVDAMPAEALQATGVALMGALNKGLGSALTQPVEGGDAGQTMGTQMIQTLADGLTSSLQADGAADMLIPAVNAFGTAFNSTLGKAMTSTIMPKGQTGMVGEEAAGGIGGKLVQSLADGLTTSLQTEGTAEKFIPAVNALGTVLNTAMQTASEGASQAGDPSQQDQQAASGFGQQMVQGLATGLANGITAAPPEMFIPVTNALGTQLGAAMSQAAQQAQPPGGVGPVNPQVGDAGLSMVQGLTQGLTDSITAAPPETFYPVANALGSQLGTALNDAMTKTVGVGENTTGGMVGEDAAGGIGAQMVSNLATGLSDSITNAPEEVFTPVGAALGTKMTEALQAAVEGGAQGTAGADGATGVGQQMGEAVGQMLISGVEQADWAPVGTSLSTKLGETLQTVATENGDISTQLGDSVGQMLQQGVEGADFSGVGEQLTTQLNDQMTSAIEDVSSQISDSMSQITEAISEAVSQMGEAIGEATEQVSQAVEEMSQSIEEATESVSQAVEEMSQSVEQAGEAMSQAAEEASSSAEEIGTAAEEAAAAVEAAMQSMAAAVQAAAGAIASAAGQIVASLNQIAGAAQAASSAVGAVGGMAPAGGAGGTARSAEVGEAMVQGTARGMETAAPMVARSSQLVADTAYDAMADAVQMGSPAERFVPVGRSITQGMMKGMLAEAKSRLKSAMGKMAGQVASAMGKIKSAMASGIGQVQSRIKEAMGRVKGEAASGGQAAGAAAARGSAAGVDSASDENEKAVRRMWKKALKKLLEGKGEMRFLGEEFAREFWLGMLDTAGSLEFAQFVTDQAVAAAENAIEAIRAKMQGLATQLEIVGNTIADLESELASIDSQLAAMDAAAAEEAARAAAQARIDAAQELLDKQKEITAELEKQFSREFNEAHQAHIRAVQAGSKGAPQAEYEAKLAKATQTNSLLQQSKAMEEHLAKELEMIRKAIEAESKAREAATKAQARAELEARRAALQEELAAAKQQQAELAAAQHAAQVEYTQTVIAESQKRIDQLKKEKQQADSPEERAKAQAEIELEKQKIDLANQLADALERQANAKSPEELAQANAQIQYLTEALAGLDEVDIGAMLEELVSKMGEVATSMSSAATSMGDAAAAMSSMEAPATAAASSVSEVGQAAGGAAGGMQDMGAKYHEVMSQMAADGYAFQEQFKAMTDQVRGTAETAGTDIGLALSDGITNRITQGGPALQQAMVDGLQTGVDAADAVADKGGDDIATSFGQAMRDTLGVQFPPLQEQIRTGLQKPIDDGIKAAEKGGTDIGKGLMGEAKVGLDNGSPPFQRTVKKTIDDPVRDGIRAANQGGRQIGNALGDGMQQGVRDRAKAIADEAARTVRDAVNAANREARAHSPSEEMREVGHNLGDGLIYGMRDRRRDAHEESERLIHIPRLSPMDDGGVTGNRARRSGDSAGRTIHIENLNLPGVQDGPQLVEYLENLMRTNGVSAGRR